MANYVFNIAKGRVNELVRRVDIADDPGGTPLLRLKLYKVFSGADDDYEACDTLGAVEAISTTTVADFTGYGDITLDATELVTPTPNDVSDFMAALLDNQTWAAAGGASNNTLVKLVIYYDPTGTSGNSCIPLTAHDFAITTNGGDLVADFDDTNGFFKAS